MELDDLKQSWKNEEQQYKTSDYDLSNILTKKIDSPLNTLRIKYKRQLILLPVAAIVLIVMTFVKPELQHNAMIWVVVPLMIFQICRYYLNYRTVLKMLLTDDSGVKQRLEENLKALKKDSNRDLQLLRLILFLFIAAAELTISYDLVPAYQGLKSVGLPVRAGVYVLLFLVQPYISKYFFNLHFGQYINRLQELVDQAA